MVYVNEKAIPYKVGMTAIEAILEVGSNASNSVVVVNNAVVFDPRVHVIADGDRIKLLKLISGG